MPTQQYLFEQKNLLFVKTHPGRVCKISIVMGGLVFLTPTNPQPLFLFISDPMSAIVKNYAKLKFFTISFKILIVFSSSYNMDHISVSY